MIPAIIYLQQEIEEDSQIEEILAGRLPRDSSRQITQKSLI